MGIQLYTEVLAIIRDLEAATFQRHSLFTIPNLRSPDSATRLTSFAANSPFNNSANLILYLRHLPVLAVLLP